MKRRVVVGRKPVEGIDEVAPCCKSPSGCAGATQQLLLTIDSEQGPSARGAMEGSMDSVCINISGFTIIASTCQQKFMLYRRRCRYRNRLSDTMVEEPEFDVESREGFFSRELVLIRHE